MYDKLKMFFPVADGIAKTFGRNCEVAVHNLENPESSLIYVSGGITNRKIGAPITNIVLKELRNYGNNSRDMIGYRNATKDGNILKSSTIFIRDDNNKIIGCLCINFDISCFLNATANINELIAFNSTDNENEEKGEFFATDVSEALENIIRKAIFESGMTVSQMQKEDKVKIVLELDKKGIFLIKGSVDKLAAALGVSRYTIYNYLEEGRANTDDII